MNICGVLVHARADAIEAVRTSLAAMPGVEVHTVTPEGKMVVVVEEADDRTSGDTILAMHRTEGVLSAALVYHHFEPDPPSGSAEEASHATNQA